MSRLRNREGFVKGLLFLFILIAAAYVGVSLGKPHYRFHTLRSFTRDMLRAQPGDAKTIRKYVLSDAADLGIPLAEDDLEVIVDNRRIHVRAAWSETVDFWGYYRKKYDFVIEEGN